MCCGGRSVLRRGRRRCGQRTPACGSVRWRTGQGMDTNRRHSATVAGPAIGVSASHLRQLAADRRVPHLRVPTAGGGWRYTFDIEELVALFAVEPEVPVAVPSPVLQLPPRPRRTIVDEDPDWDAIGS